MKAVRLHKFGGPEVLQYEEASKPVLSAATRRATVSAVQVRSNGAQLQEASTLLDRGTVRVVVDSIYRLAEAARSHERAARGGVQGKLALDVA